MNVYVIVLRILHIGAGIFWAGCLLVLFRFLIPTARGVGPAAGPFMGRLTGEEKFGQIAGAAGVITILSGALLYWHDFGAVFPFNAPMTGFAIGAVAAITLWVVGTTMFRPANEKLGELGARAAQGEDVGAEMGQAAAKRDRLIPVLTTLLIIAILSMAISRYL
jgi:uncharacterized membrane protein